MFAPPPPPDFLNPFANVFPNAFVLPPPPPPPMIVGSYVSFDYYVLNIPTNSVFLGHIR
jgi:hypothetical protein